jgi:hypothetical protein
VLDQDGNIIELIDRASVIEKGGEWIGIIAVLAPVVVQGCALDEGVVFELGIARARPYQQTRIRVGRKISRSVIKEVKPRPRIRAMTHTEWTNVWPMLQAMIEELVITFFARRSELFYWMRRGLPHNEGIYFSASLSDKPIARMMYREDVRHRNELFSKFTRLDELVKYLRKMKKGVYSDSRLRSMNSARAVSALLKQCSPHIRVSLCHALKEGTTNDLLVWQIRRVFNVEKGEHDLDRHDQLMDLMYPRDGSHILASPERLRVLIREKHRKRHARGCVVGGFTLAEEILEQIFPEKVWRPKDGMSTQDDDVPF